VVRRVETDMAFDQLGRIDDLGSARPRSRALAQAGLQQQGSTVFFASVQ
jgi:hypothetical protein